jgi:hypothetical protein
MDVFWTFDLQEYRLPHEESFTFQVMLRHMVDPRPVRGGLLKDTDSLQIILIHDRLKRKEKGQSILPN